MILDSISAGQSGRARSRLAIERAIVALRAGDSIEAEQTLRTHLLEQPGDAEALARLADLAVDQRRMEEAAIHLRRAASADPSPDRRLALVRHLLAYGGPATALAEIEQLSLSVRKTFDSCALEATLLGMLGSHDRQIALLEALTTEYPLNPAPWISLGNALNTMGRAGDAVAALRQAIAVKPTCGEAYWTLANLKSFRFTAREIAAMHKAMRGKLGDSDRLHFNFALGKAFEDQEDFARSFKFYAAGNRIRSEALKPKQTRITGFVDLAIATFCRELFDRHPGAGCKARGPIFVLGLHRSGSTLIEQILSSHPMIEGTGELPVMQQIWDRLARRAAITGVSPFDAIAQCDSTVFDQIGAEYMERTRSFRRSGRPFFVDKLPANWLNVGLIRLALPNAKIIDSRRHPMACGFSNFKQHYATGVSFAYSLESIGHFYRDYLHFLSHLDAVQPGSIHRATNERLIDDPEREIRQLLDYLEVPFDPSCLDFHRNQRPVATPSAQQVRRQINREGVDAWRRFERWLEPLERSLGPALHEWDSDER